MKTHKDLTVWQKAMELVMEVYKATKMFPREEIFGLTSQMRRAVVRATEASISVKLKTSLV